MSTITNRQKIIQEETIQGGFENIVDGIDVDYEIRITKREKRKLKLELGDLVVSSARIGVVMTITSYCIIISWENSITGIDRKREYHNNTVNHLTRTEKWKIYKEVSIGELNI